MKITPRTTEAMVRAFSSASKPELEQCRDELRAIYSDFGQPAEVRFVAKNFASIVRRQIKLF